MRITIIFDPSIILEALKKSLYSVTYEKISISLAISRMLTGFLLMSPGLFALIPALDMREFYVPEDTEDVMDREVFDDNDSMRYNMTRMKMEGCNAKENIEFMWSPFLIGSFYLFTALGFLHGILENERSALAIWIFTSIMEIICSIVQLVNPNKPFLNCSKPVSALIRAGMVIFLAGCTYIVWRTYKKLKTRKCCLLDDPVGSAPTSTRTSRSVTFTIPGM